MLRPLTRAVLVAALLALGLEGCGEAGGTPTPPERTGLLADPLAELPATVSGLGVYLGGDVENPHPAAAFYEPRWPLWSNGSDKVRHLVLPEGTTVDESTDPWTFPVGTLLLKTFRYEVEGELRPFETRALRLAEAGWEYGLWRWNEAGTEATRLDMLLPVPVTATGPDGQLFEHEIPSKLQCRKCHESGDTPVLGYRGLQVGSGAVPPLDEDPETAEVLGYLVGNCIHCHNGGFKASASFDLGPDVALENLIDHPTETSGTATGVRVVPGDPAASILYLALSGDHDNPEIKPMPPEGVQLRDHVAIERLRVWIMGLGRSR